MIMISFVGLALRELTLVLVIDCIFWVNSESFQFGFQFFHRTHEGDKDGNPPTKQSVNPGMLFHDFEVRFLFLRCKSIESSTLVMQ